MISSVALKYARALLDVASERGQEQEVYEELQAFRDLLKSHRGLREALLNPVVPFLDKRRIMERLAQRIPLKPVVLNFILVILENARMGQFEVFVSACGEVLDERQGLIRGQVHSAAELSDGLRARLEETLSGVLGKRVRLACHQDDTLIGGLRLQVGSTVFDGSIRTQLDAIQKRLSS